MVSWFLTKVSTAFWERYSFSMNDAITTRKGWEAVGRGKKKKISTPACTILKIESTISKMDHSPNRH